MTGGGLGVDCSWVSNVPHSDVLGVGCRAAGVAWLYDSGAAHSCVEGWFTMVRDAAGLAGLGAPHKAVSDL